MCKQQAAEITKPLLHWGGGVGWKQRRVNFLVSFQMLESHVSLSAFKCS